MSAELPSSEHLVLETELQQLLSDPENALPLDFVSSVLVAYDRDEQLLLALFSKREYERLLRVLRDRVTEAVAKRKDRQKWVKRLVRYVRKVNTVTSDEKWVLSPEMGRWLFQLDMGVAVECLKRRDGED